MKNAEKIVEVGLKGRRQHVGRSPVFVWLWERYEKYGDQLSQRGVDWQAMAKQFAVEGIRDGRGKFPSGRTVAATFAKVKRIKSGTKPKRRAVPVKAEIRRTFGRSAA